MFILKKDVILHPKLQQVNSYHKSCIKRLYNSRIKRLDHENDEKK